MSNLDGHDPNFDEMNLPGNGEAPEEQAAELAAELTAEQPPEAQGELVDFETAELGELPAEGAEEAPAEAAGESPAEETEEGPAEAAEEGPAKGRKLPFPLEWGIAIVIPVVALALVLIPVICLSTAIYLIFVGAVALGVWKGRETNTAYTVLLACALVAILTAIYCLWAELGRYQFDLRAKQRSSLSSPIQAGLLANTGEPLPAVCHPA